MTAEQGLADSFLAGLEPRIVAAVRERSVVHHFRSGHVFLSEAEPPWTGILLAGMARLFLRTRAGRQVTLRHARRGSSVGIVGLLGEMSVSAQAVTDCEVLRLETAHVLRLARTHPPLALAIARELTARLEDTYVEMVVREQGSVRQRLARQLLLFAAEADPDRPLVLPMSHEEIADAIGSAREVVSRHLARFQAERMLALERGQIRLVDPALLEFGGQADGRLTRSPGHPREAHPRAR